MRYPHDITDLAPIEVIEQAIRENKYIVTKSRVFLISEDASGVDARCVLATEVTLTEHEYALMSGKRVLRILERQFNEED